MLLPFLGSQVPVVVGHTGGHSECSSLVTFSRDLPSPALPVVHIGVERKGKDSEVMVKKRFMMTRKNKLYYSTVAPRIRERNVGRKWGGMWVEETS